MRLPFRRGWICLLAVAGAGCTPSTATVSDPPRANFGRFEGEVVAAWDADGRKMTLREDFVYFDSAGRRWVAPNGSVVDGASIPRLFWTVIGGPFEGKYRNASVVHDVGCVEMQQSWEDVHRMFYEACRCGGVDETQAKVMYYAVFHFGPRWQRVVENMIEEVADADGQIVEREVAVHHMVRLDPPPPTPEELEQVTAYIEEDDPEPIAIERFHRDLLHRRPSRGRREGTPRSEAGGSAVRNQGNFTDRQHLSPGERPRPRDLQDRRGEEEQNRRFRQQNEMGVPPLGQAEQEWATQIVREHLEQQAGQPRQAEYSVQRAGGGYRVLVQFLHQDERGQMVPYVGGTSTARISRDGRVLEVVSGFATARVADRDG